MQKFSSDEIRNDPGLRNMRHVGLDPEQFVTLKYMVEVMIINYYTYTEGVFKKSFWK